MAYGFIGLNVLQIILDPNAPLAWKTKHSYVQRPTRYDALESLKLPPEELELDPKLENALVAAGGFKRLDQG